MSKELRTIERKIPKMQFEEFNFSKDIKWV